MLNLSPSGGNVSTPSAPSTRRVQTRARGSTQALEWAPVGAKKCLVARVEILMGENEPKMTSFLVEDLDEVLELSD